MNELIDITESMTSAEKRKARAHNRKVAYAQLEEENRNKPAIELTEEEEKRARKMLREMLRNKCPEYLIDENLIM